MKQDLQPRNIEYLLRWVRENYPEGLSEIQQMLSVEGGAGPFVIGFEAGRLFQFENPDTAMNNPNAYVVQPTGMPERAPADPALPALVSKDQKRFGCPSCRKLVGSVEDGLLPQCKCGQAILPPKGWGVDAGPIE